MSSHNGFSSSASPAHQGTGQTYYDILKVDIDASEQDIKKAYRELVQIWHPDLNRNNARTAEHKTSTINEAYRHLINSQSRSRYDQMLKRQKQNLAVKYGNDNAGANSSGGLLKQFLMWLKAGDQNGR